METSKPLGKLLRIRSPAIVCNYNAADLTKKSDLHRDGVCSYFAKIHRNYFSSSMLHPKGHYNNRICLFDLLVLELLMEWCITLISVPKLVVSELPDGSARVPAANRQFTRADDMILLPISMDTAIQQHVPFRRRMINCRQFAALCNLQTQKRILEMCYMRSDGSSSKGSYDNP